MTKNQFIKYPLDHNPIIEYHNKIQSNEVTVSRKVKRVYEELVRRIHDENYEYEYSPKHANHAIEFIENYCVHSKDATRKPLKLLLWQKALVAATFGMIHKETGVREVKELILIVARKNAKSALASCLALYLLYADNEQSAEIVCAATTKEQARLTWKESVAMVKSSPALFKRGKCLVNEIKIENTFSSFKPVSSEARNLDGGNYNGIVIDELHSIKDINIYDVLVDSTTARKQPLTIITTTSGFIEKESPYEKKYEEIENIINGYDDEDGYKDNRVLPIVYELDTEEEVHNEDMWIKANPSIDVIKDRAELRRKYLKARSIAGGMRNLLCKDFNRRQTSSQSWLTWETLNNEETFDITNMGFKYGILGFDKSETTDLTAATLLLMRPNDEIIYSYSMYWLPSMTLEERSKEDNIPYDLFERQGLLRTSGEYKIDMTDVLKWVVEIREQYGIYILWCGYDPWHVDDSTLENFESEFGKNSMIKIRQGAVTLSEPMKSFEADLRAKLINYNNNNITKMCFANTQIKVDTNGNIAPVKGRDRRKRIDGTISHLCAYTILQDKKNDYLNII